jgi:ribonuclease HII
VTRRWSPIERGLRESVGPLIAGVDEVGRGPLAGPVVACAVVMPPDARAIAGVDDSKRLVPDERTRLARLVLRKAIAVGVGAASVREIDRLNIYHATVLAMRRALVRLGLTPDHVLVDGKAIRTLPIRHTAIVGGDASCYSIACASIVAKVTRDRLMRALARRYPGYAWERNVGYATRDHLRGLEASGATPHHRRSFMHVRQLDLGLDTAEALAMLAEAAAGGEGALTPLLPTLEAALDDACDATRDAPMIAPPLAERIVELAGACEPPPPSPADTIR